MGEKNDEYCHNDSNQESIHSFIYILRAIAQNANTRKPSMSTRPNRCTADFIFHGGAFRLTKHHESDPSLSLP
jgi:hypothetical protein